MPIFFNWVDKFLVFFHCVSIRVTKESCILADRRMASIRQQSDQLQSVIDRKKIAASPATVYRRREEVRMKALANSENILNTESAIRLCYDRRVIHKMDRYVFLGQLTDSVDNELETDAC